MQFSKRAKEVMNFAEQEARSLNHSAIDGHHVLVGIVKKGTGVAAQELLNRNVNLDALRDVVRKLIPPIAGQRISTSSMLFQETQLQVATECADKWVVMLDDKEICPIHLLLGMMEVCDVHVLRILAEFGIKPSELGDTITKAYQKKKADKVLN